MWYDCTECIFGSNSQKLAIKHTNDTGHTCTEEEN